MSEDQPEPSRPFKTRKTLIERIAGDCESSWQEFHQIYEKFVGSILRRFGVVSADKDDEAQKVFLELVRDLKKPDAPNFRKRSFGSWFGQKVKWRALQYHRAKERREQATSPEAMPQGLSEAELERIWQKEWARKKVQVGMTRVKESPRNIQIFNALAIDERPMEEVCAEFEISRSNADTIKKRVKDKLAEILISIDEGEF